MGVDVYVVGHRCVAAMVGVYSNLVGVSSRVVGEAITSQNLFLLSPQRTKQASSDRCGFLQENVSTHYVLCLCVLYRTGTVGGHGLSGRKKVSTKDLETSKKTPNAFSLRKKAFPLCKKEF